MRPALKTASGALCLFLLALSLAACGAKKEAGVPSSTPSTTPAATTTSTVPGVDTKTIDHSEYLAGSHAAFLCTDCHSVPRAEICAQSGCHPLSDYTTTHFDHAANYTGNQCSQCHKSDTPATAVGDNTIPAGYGGFRRPLRIAHALFHDLVTGACLDCHTKTGLNAPASHNDTTTYPNSCENCHSYKNGAISGGHVNVSTGCADCHTKASHYDNSGQYACELCHKTAISGGFSSWAESYTDHTTRWDSTSCLACHATASGGHLAVTTDCLKCHTAKFTVSDHTGVADSKGALWGSSANISAQPCEWCHAKAVTGGFQKWSRSHSSYTNDSCNYCH